VAVATDDADGGDAGMSRRHRLTAAAGLALAELRHDRTRTLLAVLGVTLAVLATTTLAGTGLGVVETGEEKFDAAGRDLWVTGGPVRFAPGSVGGVETSIRDSHRVAGRIRDHEGVGTVGILLFQTVYVSDDGEDFRTLAALGTPSSAGLAVSDGRGFGDDPHYAGGDYDGPMTHEMLIDRRTADVLGVGVNDTLYVGGTVADARRHEFRVVGISSTGSRFLGVPTVSLPLSELQEVTGKTASDPATIIAVQLDDGASVGTVESDLQAAYPGYDVRTNREQLRATLERQAVVLAGGSSLVVLAVLAGLALTLNALLAMLYRQFETYAALRALGVSTGTLTVASTVQALVVGTAGGLLGIGLAVPLAAGLDRAVRALVGFENVVRLPPRVLALGFGIAVAMSLVSAFVAGRGIRGLRPLDELAGG
jgi:putative ABC transport system permease protein